jgi:1-acyl-sn-glycerol-3-phosphate acyltransferase
MIWPIKTIFLFSSIFLCTALLILIRCLFFLSLHKRNRLISFIIYLFGKVFTLILGVRVEIGGEKTLLKKRGVFFVSNHLSYLDGIIATSLSPLVFIARGDLRQWPFFGIFSLLSNTIFVERNSRYNLQRDISKIVGFLKSKVNVILYPEGTSTDGKKLLPFKSSFFAAAQEAGCMIVPLAIKYKKINAQSLSKKNQDLVYWYGDMEFLPHLWKVLKLDKILVEVRVCRPQLASEFTDKPLSSARKCLSESCRLSIVEGLQ